MGRIAEALKKAERERRTHTAEADGGVAVLTPSDTDPVGTATIPVPPTAAPADVPPGAGGPSPGPAPEPVEGLSESLVAYYERSSLITEQYRALRTRLLSQNPHNEHRILAITSSAPKEGKSITTANLALTMAEIHHLNVLVVDADFRRSSLAGVFNLHRSPGLADLLAGEVAFPEAVQQTPVPNLHFIASGELRGRSASELLGAISAHSVFRWFQSHYHYVFVDTPPATTVTDVGVVGQLCSGVLMVIRLRRTPEPLVKRAVRLLVANNIPIVGSVLVGRDERSSEYGYQYNYYRYYDYGIKQNRPGT